MSHVFIMDKYRLVKRTDTLTAVAADQYILGLVLCVRLSLSISLLTFVYIYMGGIPPRPLSLAPKNNLEISWKYLKNFLKFLGRAIVLICCRLISFEINAPLQLALSCIANNA